MSLSLSMFSVSSIKDSYFLKASRVFWAQGLNPT